jgi:hypothetical protein
MPSLTTPRRAAALLALALAGTADAASLLVNGGFETGDLSGWTAASQAGGNFGGFFIDGAAGYTPLTYQPSAGPAGGSFHAVSDRIGESSAVLYQPFTLGTASRLQLSFRLFVNNQAGAAVGHPAGLDFSAGPNQHARVDILAGDADPFDTGAGVLANLYLGSDAGTGLCVEHHVVLAPVFAAGSYLLRFGDVANLAFLNTGVDDVALVALPVPEPHGFALAGLGLGAVAWAVRRRR